MEENTVSEKNVDLNESILLEIGDSDFTEGSVSPKIEYKIRKAARGILIFGNKIALLNVSNKNYHKLPGGGLKKVKTRKMLSRENS